VIGSGLLPYEDLDERDVAGAVVACPLYVRGIDELEPGDFYRPDCARVFALWAQLAPIVFLADRETLVAASARVPVGEIDRWVRERPGMWDFAEAVARIRDAKRRRDAVLLIDAARAALDAGEPVDEVVERLRCA
jgi:hypothetical protein